VELLFSGSNTADQAQGAIIAIQGMTLDTDIWPVTVELAFSEDPDPSQPDEFAVTNEVEPGHYLLAFRNDAPHFQNGAAAAHYDITRFYYETVIHELGHVFSFAMNDTGRNLLSRLWGVENTSEAWFPTSLSWADRAGEAIAETFKEAFLPADMREYANRTNRPLRYSYMPFFRAIFRNAVTDDMLRDTESMMDIPPGTLGSVPLDPPIGVGGVGDDGGIDIPAYDLDLFGEGDIDVVSPESAPGGEAYTLSWDAGVTDPASITDPGHGLVSYGGITAYSAGSNAQVYMAFDAGLVSLVTIPDEDAFGFSEVISDFDYAVLLGGGWNLVHGDELPDPIPRYEFRGWLIIGDDVYSQAIWFEERTVYPNIWPDTSGGYHVLVGSIWNLVPAQPGDTIAMEWPAVPFDRDGDVESCGVPFHDARMQSVIALDVEMTNGAVAASDLIPELLFLQPEANACPFTPLTPSPGGASEVNPGEVRASRARNDRRQHGKRVSPPRVNTPRETPTTPV
jgi:hypothetical protein